MHTFLLWSALSVLSACKPQKQDTSDTSSDSASPDSGRDSTDSAAKDSGRADTAPPDTGEPAPATYDLTKESFAVEVVWTGTQGGASENNFNGKNYHSMSAWRAGYTYLVYVDNDYIAQVVKISDDGSEVTSAALTDYQVLADGHHAFSIGIDADGYLHVSGDMHNYPDKNADHMPASYQEGKCMYWRSVEPHSIDDFEWLGDGPDGQMPYGDSFSYMTFANDRSGELFYYARTRTKYLPEYSNKQVFTVSRYDSVTREWHWIGAEATSDRRSVATLLGNDNENGSGSYTRIHGWVYFDPTNQMHMTANVIEGSNNFQTSPHYATHSLYLRADSLGENAARADGAAVELPGNAESGHPQQADFAYHDPSNSLATFTSVVTDQAQNPIVLLKKQYRDASGANTGDEMLLVGWSGTEWIDHGDLDGLLTTGDNSRIYADPQGVISVPIGTGLVRFFDPAEQVQEVELGTSLDNVDRTYVQATGDLQALTSNGSELQLVRVSITRPEGG